MRVLIVEDDYLQAEWLQDALTEQYRALEAKRIRSEKEFRQRLVEVKEDMPDIILIDVMLRWTDPDIDAPAPDEVKSGGYYRAGLRCERLLRDSEETREIPVIFYTRLERTDLADEINRLSAKSRYIGKSSDTTLLFEAIRELVLSKVDGC